MRKVELRMNELLKYETIKNFVEHGGNKNHIALKLGITVRQVNRLIKKYKEKGKSRLYSWEPWQATKKDPR